MNCPKCDSRMSHDPADPEVGIPQGAWICNNDDCGHTLFDSEIDEVDDYVRDTDKW